MENKILDAYNILNAAIREKSHDKKIVKNKRGRREYLEDIFNSALMIKNLHDIGDYLDINH